MMYFRSFLISIAFSTLSFTNPVPDPDSESLLQSDYSDFLDPYPLEPNDDDLFASLTTLPSACAINQPQSLIDDQQLLPLTARDDATSCAPPLLSPETIQRFQDPLSALEDPKYPGLLPPGQSEGEIYKPDPDDVNQWQTYTGKVTIEPPKSCLTLGDRTFIYHLCCKGGFSKPPAIPWLGYNYYWWKNCLESEFSNEEISPSTYHGWLKRNLVFFSGVVFRR